MAQDVNTPPVKHPRWTEVTVTLPTAARDVVIGWFMDRGSAGVQEDYPGLYPLDGDGPVTSGDPKEWHGEAAPNPGATETLKGWLPPPVSAELEKAALLAFLESLVYDWPDAKNWQVDACEIDSVDWNAEWKSHWKPINVGRRFIICPTWEVPPDNGREVILLDPGMAFGTGTHFTTASCIEEAEDYFDRISDPASVSVLDVGTGSGILAIAALKMGAREAFGIDVDPDAARESIVNADTNCVADRYAATDRPLSGHEGLFELVFANILAQTLIALAKPIAATVMPGGTLITSGILQEHEDDVVKKFAGLGLDVVSARHDEAWSTITFEKSGY